MLLHQPFSDYYGAYHALEELYKDLLGRTYEYCIAQFAAYEGVKGGEFYTPSSVVRTLVEILRPFSVSVIYIIHLSGRLFIVYPLTKTLLYGRIIETTI